MAQKLYKESEDYYSQLKSQCKDKKTENLLKEIDQLNELNADNLDDEKIQKIIDNIKNNAKSIDVLQELVS